MTFLFTIRRGGGIIITVRFLIGHSDVGKVYVIYRGVESLRRDVFLRPADGRLFFLEVAMQYKAEIMDEAAVRRSVARITHEIIERYRGTENVILLGIRRRGLPLANMIAENVVKFEGRTVPVGYIDITFYRDDLSQSAELPEAADTHIPCDLNGKHVVLVDDVIYTGRTARAAIEGVFSHGRPASIGLAVLCDRGHRELPIRPDFVGKNIPTAKSEMIAVHVPEYDGDTKVLLYDV